MHFKVKTVSLKALTGTLQTMTAYKLTEKMITYQAGTCNLTQVLAIHA